jgi:uncharacterized protein (TIGR02268 family)
MRGRGDVSGHDIASPRWRFCSVHPSSPAALLALAVLIGATAAAQPRATSCATGIRRIELRTEPTSAEPELCISPDVSTLLLFEDGELIPGSVTVEGQDRFTLVDAGSTVLRLLPSERMMPGERLRVAVRFKDGAAPSSAAFWLVVSPGKAERWVEVYRHKRTVESYQQEVKEQAAQLHQCREDNARLRAEKDLPGGLAGFLATLPMDKASLLVKQLSVRERPPKNATRVDLMLSYRSHGTVAVAVTLGPTPGMQTWTTIRAELVGPGRRMLSVKHPWQQSPITDATQDRRVIIEADATEEETRGSFTLKLWEADGTRSITLSGVTFP